MTHQNFYTFKANTHYELGTLMGNQFATEAQTAIAAEKKESWDKKLKIGEQTLSFTQKYFPQYIEEMQGYAKGANVEFLDLWTVSLEYDIEIAEEARCTNIVTNNGKLIGHNEDSRINGKDDVCIVKKTLGDLTTLEIYYYNTLGGNSIGINSHGYVHFCNTLFFVESKVGLPRNVLARYLFETANPEESIKKVSELPRMSGYNHNLVNKNGQLWNVELTADQAVFSKPTLPFVHSNHCLNIETYNDDCAGTLSRLEFAKTHSTEHMQVPEIQKLLEDTSLGYDLSICNERTVAKVIVDLDSNVAKIWLLRESEVGWVDYPLKFW